MAEGARKSNRLGLKMFIFYVRIVSFKIPALAAIFQKRGKFKIGLNSKI
jgi:preprotein translocase subunit SecB